MPEQMQWPYIAGALFVVGWSCLFTWAIRSFSKLVTAVESMKDSVSSLNVNVAVVVEKVSNHEKRIERLEDR